MTFDGLPVLRTYAAILAMLIEAFTAHIEARLARLAGRRSARAESDLRTWLDDILPGVLLGAQGIDGRLVWGLAVMELTRRHSAIERRFAAERGLLPEATQGMFAVFAVVLATSDVGLTWSCADTSSADGCRRGIS